MPQLLDSDAREDDPRLAEVADIMAAMAEQAYAPGAVLTAAGHSNTRNIAPTCRN
jgi:hypothetical protein